jgi:pimeloyl-ACP methyl ester carboxylesterase
VPYLDRNGVQIWYEEHGRGPAVLLTHGYGATATMWEPQIRGLDSYRLIVWDIRGHGRSDSPEDPSAYSVPACLADMAAILDACGVDRAVIGGLSLGGYLSLAFLLDYASYVRALMLFDTGPGYRKQEGRNAWNAMAERYAQVLEARGLAGLGSTGEVRPTDHRSARGLALAARGILTQHDARVIDALPAMQVPALVLWGERDEAFVKPGETMAAKIPGARRLVVAGAGHAANLDRPAEFNAALTQFLESVGA